MNLKWCLFFALLAIGFDVTAQDCDCYSEYLHMKRKVEANYAGFRDKVNAANTLKYKNFSKSTEIRIKKVTAFKSCTNLLRQWLLFFKDGHLYLSADDTTEYTKTFPPSFYKIDNDFCLLQIPSFDYEYKEVLDSIVIANHSVIANTPNLIIDITGNSGGSDNTYYILLPYVFTHPVTIDAVELWASDDNIKAYENIANDTSKPAAIRIRCAELVNKMKKHTNDFVNLFDVDTIVKTADTIYPFPKKVAILTDTKNASSAEQFLLEASRSNRVITFGTGNTSGTLDYSNLYFEKLPSNKRGVYIPTTRSLRVRKKPFDAYGFHPAVKIPITTKDKIAFIKQYLSDRRNK